MGAIDEERAGVMILRAWVEPGHEDRLRVRIIQLVSGRGGRFRRTGVHVDR